MTPKDLPFDLKLQLHELAEVLPAKARPIFLREAGNGICDFAQELIRTNKNAIVFGAIGYIVGAIIHTSIKSIPLIGVPLGALIDVAPVLLGLAGAGYGFMRDREVERLERIIHEAILKARTYQM